MTEVPRSNRPAPPAPGVVSALNALDLALASQELESEREDCLRAFFPLLEGVEKLCRGLDQCDPVELVRKAESLALLTEIADRSCAQIGLERIGNPGERVQRERHEVVLTETRVELPHGTVLEVLQHGWLFDNRVLSQARVIASQTSQSQP